MTATDRPWLLVVAGATGTGKSELALGLATRLGGEIVGCDALQVYRGLDAATAKPSTADRRRVPHHLIDCVDPRAEYTMAEFVRSAEATIAAIVERGNVPIVAGGTGLYLRGLLRGMLTAPPRDPVVRRRLRRIVERGGANRLHAALARRDPASAERIAPSDTPRLMRAVELAFATEETWSERLRREGSWSASPERYRALKLGLRLAPELHHARLDRRVDRFFDAGLVAEVRGLLRTGLAPEANALRAIGYREVVRAIAEGRDPETTRDEVRSNTRRYAKRQRTWFRAEPGMVWLDAATDLDRRLDRALRLWSAHVGDAHR